MSLSTNSILLSVLGPFLLIDFSHYGLYFFLLSCLLSLIWMSDIVTYWDYIFCISKNLLELYYVKQLSYLETILFFQVSKALLVRTTRVAFSLGLIGYYYWSKTLLNTLPDSLWLMRFFIVVGRNRHSAQLCMSPDGYWFWVVLSLASGIFASHISADLYLVEDLRGIGIILQIFSVLSLCRSALQTWSLWCLPRHPASSPQIRETALLPLGSLPSLFLQTVDQTCQTPGPLARVWCVCCDVFAVDSLVCKLG